MNIAVCLKQVPDTEARLKIRENQLDLTDIKMVVSPFDEYAVEEAIRIKEKMSDTQVTVLSVGTDKVKEAIKWAFSIGADSGILLKDTAFEGSDSLGVARILAKAIQMGNYQLILCGKLGVDDDAAQVGPAIAEVLGIPHVSVVTKLEIAPDGSKATCHREIEGGAEIIETTLPAVISAEKGLNEVRYASLKGIMAAKKKQLTEIDAQTLGIDTSSVGAAGAKLEVLELTPPPSRAAGKIVPGDSPEEKVANLVKLLREEAKVI